MLVRLEGLVEERDLKPSTYPPLKELRRIQYRSVCLGSYIPWDVKRQYDIISKELGWKGEVVENVPPEYCYEKIECQFQGVRDYIKFIKRGYSRPSHLASIDIRHGRLDRREALKIVEEFEGKRPASLDIFLDYVGLSEEEFMQVALGHQVSPYRHDPSSTQRGGKTHDFDKWVRTGNMPREEAESQLERWKRRGG
jgi:hypothetical protein